MSASISFRIEDVQLRLYRLDYERLGNRWVGTLRGNASGLSLVRIEDRSLMNCRVRMGRAFVDLGILVRNLTEGGPDGT